MNAKDATIEALLARLNLVERRWIVVDHWQADRCAIGIATATEPARLVYVSTYRKRDGFFDYECELPAVDARDVYRVAREGTDVSFEELLAVMIGHLNEEPRSTMVGEPSRFALELIRFDETFGAVRVWVAGKPFGEWDEQSLIASLKSEAEYFVSKWGSAPRVPSIEMTIDETRRWAEGQMEAACDTLDERRAISHGVHSSMLYAYAPEGLSSVRTVILCNDANCAVTCWDVGTGDESQRVLPRDEVIDVIRSFVERIA